jgi:hypothetical protein
MEHFAFILFVICSIVLFGVSYLSPVPGTDKTSGLTYEKSPITKKLNPDRFYSILVVVSVILVWIYFA